MTKRELTASFYRLKEMLIGSVIMSLIGCLLCISGFMPVESAPRDITLALLPPIYIVWNLFELRGCYAMVMRKKSYYAINLCATVMFILISVLSYLLLPRKLYSCLFLVTYLASFSRLGISGTEGILMFFAVITASVFFAIVKMDWVQEKVKKHKKEMASMPPVMETTPEVTTRRKTEE